MNIQVDFGDQTAAAITEFELQCALQNRRYEWPVTGTCYSCQEPLAAGTFCDADCRHDYQRRQDNKR